jgi:hypothetical protein
MFNSSKVLLVLISFFVTQFSLAAPPHPHPRGPVHKNVPHVAPQNRGSPIIKNNIKKVNRNYQLKKAIVEPVTKPTIIYNSNYPNPSAPTPNVPTNTSNSPIYQWVDEYGNIYFTDQPK